MNKFNHIYKTPNEKTLTLLIGIPGVGKSTLAKNLLQKDPLSRIIVASDEIRLNLLKYKETGIDHNPEIEPIVWGIIKKEVRKFLLDPQKKECILDATNIRKSGRKPFIEMAREFKCKTRAIVLYAPLKKIKNRNLSRSRIVSETVIDIFYKKYQKPKKSEFDEIIEIGSKKKYERDYTNQKSGNIILKINGYDIMNKLKIPQGKKIGEILNYLKLQIKNGNLRNKRKLLLKACINEFSNDKNKTEDS